MQRLTNITFCYKILWVIAKLMIITFKSQMRRIGDFKMKLLTPERYEEYEQFLKENKKGHFLQSLAWTKVKDMWKNEILIVEDENGKIKGSMSLLIRKVPIFPLTIMYSPRGPVCDIYDKETIKELVEGAKELAKKHNSYVLKIDPDVPSDNTEFVKILEENLFTY